MSVVSARAFAAAEAAYLEPCDCEMCAGDMECECDCGECAFEIHCVECHESDFEPDYEREAEEREEMREERWSR